jgi:hypothetical protein
VRAKLKQQHTIIHIKKATQEVAFLADKQRTYLVRATNFSLIRADLPVRSRK